MIHELKTDPKYFEAIRKGEKTFEVRENDRCFVVGDYLALNEFDRSDGVYTGRSMILKVTFMLDDKKYCIKDYAILGIKPCVILNADWQGGNIVTVYDSK